MKISTIIITSFILFIHSINTYSLPVKTETALFAGGCFWSMQHDFEKLPGIISTTVGYTGGTLPNPTYQQVSTGTTGHYESIQIIFDPEKTSYEKLLTFYWHDTDPTNSSGQFCDTGTEYQPVIFYLNKSQEKIAQDSKQALIKSKKLNAVATKILPAKSFYPAEDYHQHFSDKNSDRYNTYRTGCKRDQILNSIWGTTQGQPRN